MTKCCRQLLIFAKKVLHNLAILLFLASIFGFRPSMEDIAPQIGVSVVFTLKDEIFVQKPVVMLSDISECSSQVDFCSEIYGIELSKAPKLGKKLVFGREDLKKILNIEWPHITVVLNGAETSTVFSKGVVLTKKEINQAMQSFWKKIKQTNQNKRFIINEIYSPDTLRVTSLDGELVCDDVVDRIERLLTHRIEENIKLLCRYIQPRFGYEDGPFIFRMRIKQQEKALFTKYDIEKDQLISSYDVESRWCDSKGNISKIIKDIKYLKGKKAKVPIRENSIIYASSVYKPPIVSRGDVVTILFSRPGLILKGKVKTLSSGSEGDIINVKVIPSQKVITAKVVDKSTVIGAQ